MRKLHVGDSNVLSAANSVALLGSLLESGRNDPIGLSMMGYILNLKEVALNDVYNKDGFLITTARIDTTARQVAGPLLRAAQLYFRAIHDVTILGTTAGEVPKSVLAAMEFSMHRNR